MRGLILILLLLVPTILMGAHGYSSRLTDQDALNAINRSNYLEISKGRQPTQTTIFKFGANASVGTSFEPATSSGTYQTPTTAQALEVLSSDNVNDKAGGTGALSVKIEGLGPLWELQEETVALNGSTAVALTNTFTRVFRMSVASSGTYANAAGPSHNSTITLRGSGGGVTWASVESESGFGLAQSEMGAYTIPKGYTGYVLSASIDVEANKPLVAVLFIRPGADTIAPPYSPMQVAMIRRAIEVEKSKELKAPLNGIPGPADIGIMAKVGTGTASIEVDFQLILVQD